MDESYLDLGRMIAGQCPPGFSEAVLEARLDGDEADLGIRCILADGSSAEPPLGRFARDALHERLVSLRAEEGRDWRACTVTLTRGGGFQMEVHP